MTVSATERQFKRSAAAMTISATERQNLDAASRPGGCSSAAGMPISATERQFKRSASAAMTISATERQNLDAASDEEIRGSKRSSEEALPDWIILNRFGARQDNFCGDYTTSTRSYTSIGQKIIVSLKLVEPPGTSLLTLDWPEGPHPQSTQAYPKMIAADRNALLFEIFPRNMHPPDYFIYQTRSDPSQPPYLLRLPGCYDKALSADRPRQRLMHSKGIGLLCCSSGSLVVAELSTREDSPSVDIYMLWPLEDREWQIFERLPVRRVDDCANDGPDLFWWSTDAVVSFRSCYLVWVDYYKGMIIGKVDQCYLQSSHRPDYYKGMGMIVGKLDKCYLESSQKPELQYVSLPVDPVRGDPDSSDYGRGCPEASRSLCVANNSLMFVIVSQHKSSFNITLWSMGEDYRWREEASLDADELWALNSEIPHVRPEFPVVNLKNPEVVCFLLNNSRYSTDSGAIWMIEVHMKERRLLGATAYSKDISLLNQNLYMTARRMSKSFSFISSQLPFRGAPPAQTPNLPAICHGRAGAEPVAVIKARMMRGIQEVLVQWRGQEAVAASWMPVGEFRGLYPAFQLEDELFVQAGRDVMYGRKFERRNKKHTRTEKLEDPHGRV